MENIINYRKSPKELISKDRLIRYTIHERNNEELIYDERISKFPMIFDLIGKKYCMVSYSENICEKIMDAKCVYSGEYYILEELWDFYCELSSKLTKCGKNEFIRLCENIMELINERLSPIFPLREISLMYIDKLSYICTISDSLMKKCLDNITFYEKYIKSGRMRLVHPFVDALNRYHNKVGQDYLPSLQINQENFDELSESNFDCGLIIKLLKINPGLIFREEYMSKFVMKCSRIQLDDIYNLTGYYKKIIHFENACHKMPNMDTLKYSNNETYEKITYFLDHKLIPNEKCFNASIENFLDYRSLSHSKNINLLIQNGYKLTYRNVLDALKENIIINDVEKYEFNFDEEYYKICMSNGVIPPYKVSIKFPMYLFEDQFGKYNNFKMIKELIKIYKFTPNRKCLEKNMHLRESLQTLRFLVEKYNLEIEWKNLYCKIKETYHKKKLKEKCKSLNKQIKKWRNEIKDIKLYENIIESWNVFHNLICLEKRKELLYMGKALDDKMNTWISLFPEEFSTEDFELYINECPLLHREKKTKSEKVKPEKKSEIISTKENKMSICLYDNISNKIPKKIKKHLGIDRNDITYLEFRRMIMDYLEKEKRIQENEIIVNGELLGIKKYDNSIGLGELNRWIYDLLE
jgi:hypothetical protein